LVSLLRWFILPIVLAMSWFAPRIGDRWLSRLEQFAARFSRRKGRVIFTVAVVSIIARLLLLWAKPVPIPFVHDEFSYLLQADTFLHGRLTNPPHPMAVFLDTFHVLYQPTYQSMYPPAQGGVLALGRLLGHPWIGVLLSIAALCAAITWALQQWLPPNWALLGGLIVLLRIDLFNYWCDSYWGGAVAAIGGALVLGAYRRILRRQAPADAVVMGIGIALLANSRPLEGFIFCIPIAVALLWWPFSKQAPPLYVTARKVLLPLTAVLMATAVFMGYYNWRVTQNCFVFPRALYQRERLNLPVFLWQSPKPPLHYSNPQFEQFYNVIEPELYYLSWDRLSRDKIRVWWGFYFGFFLWLAFAALPKVFQDRRMRLPLLQFVGCALGLLAVRYFFPHYAAPLTVTLILLLAQAMRHLRRWELKGRPIGVFLTRAILALQLFRVALLTADAHRQPPPAWSVYRAKMVKQLEATTGKHLVIVHYAPEHFADHEWVYNGADIDGSKIVWAREIPQMDMTPLLEYFRDRKVWVVEADLVPPKLESVTESPADPSAHAIPP
jgi:hypothetical protein